MSPPRRLRVLVVDGPNLNVLGTREPALYGSETLPQTRAAVAEAAKEEGAAVEFFQSNHEGEIVERLQKCRGTQDGILINPGAYTHTSVAIRDALLYCGVPAVEVHLSNPGARESFRKLSYIEDVAAGRISGFGGHGYVLALRGLVGLLRKRGVRARR